MPTAWAATPGRVVQGFHGNYETHSLPGYEVLRGNPAVLKYQLPGGGGADTHFVFLLAVAEARCSLLHYECAGALAPRSGSVRAITVYIWASPPLVIHCFVPLST